MGWCAWGRTFVFGLVQTAKRRFGPKLHGRYAFGEASVFAPGQFTLLHPAVPLPEGPLHFAGEHTSLKHAWIEGAVESAVRAALEVHTGKW